MLQASIIHSLFLLIGVYRKIIFASLRKYRFTFTNIYSLSVSLSLKMGLLILQWILFHPFLLFFATHHTSALNASIPSDTLFLLNFKRIVSSDPSNFSLNGPATLLSIFAILGTTSHATAPIKQLSWTWMFVATKNWRAFLWEMSPNGKCHCSFFGEELGGKVF